MITLSLFRFFFCPVLCFLLYFCWVQWIPAAISAVGAIAGAVKGSQKGSGSTPATVPTSGTSWQTSRQALPSATPMQAYGENALMQMMQGYNPQGQLGLAGQSTGAMSNLFGGAAPQVSPQQQALIQGQTQNFMRGLQQQLEQYAKGAKSGNQQYWQGRGLPGSSMEVGGQSNIDAQMMQQLAQGYTQAKGQELQNLLQYPMQNLQYMQGMGSLQQQYNQPFLEMINQLGMSRLQGPRDVTQTGATTGTAVAQQGASTGGGIMDILGGAKGGLEMGQGLNTLISLFGNKGSGGSGNTTPSGWVTDDTVRA